MSAHLSKSFLHIISVDLYRYGSGISIGSFFKHYFSTPGFRYTFWLRLAACLSQARFIWRPVHYLCRAILYHYSLKYGISIPYNTKIGLGLYIGHHGGIVINHKTVIGRDCNLNHGVTIGEKFGGKNPGTPIIGDRTYLGPGCKIIGRIRLGDDAAVGANAVVLDSVPDSGVVTGVPAKVISFKGSVNYVVNTGL